MTHTPLTTKLTDSDGDVLGRYWLQLWTVSVVPACFTPTHPSSNLCVMQFADIHLIADDHTRLWS